MRWNRGCLESKLHEEFNDVGGGGTGRPFIVGGWVGGLRKKVFVIVMFYKDDLQVFCLF